MKSSVLSALFVLIIACLILQAQSQGCTCGGLGEGSNPCTQSEVVVKATKLPKPTYFVPAEEIKDAATVKNIQTGCSNSESESNSSPCNSNGNTCGCDKNPNTQSESIECNDNSCSCNKQNIETLDIEDFANSNGNVAPKFPPIGDLCYPLPMEPNSGKIIEKTKVTPAYPGKLVCCPPSVPHEICINTATGETKSKTLSSSDAASETVSHGSINFDTLSQLKSAIHNLPLVYAHLNNENRQKQYSKMSMSSSSSDCFDDATGETQGHNSAPAIPADAVSLTLAYKNLRAPNVIYRQGKQFVPEDKLSFGHRTVPVDVKSESQIPDIAEEKLVTVNKPIVELKIAPQKTVVIGTYDEQEEAKLAELEAIERESIMQEETSDQESLITYKDLGYAPIDATYTNTKPMSYNQGISNGKIDDSEGEPCGPLGSPIPGYIPGKIIVQEKFIDDSFSNSESRSCPT